MRNGQLDGLRGYAASAVIIYHCLGEAVFNTPFLADARNVSDVLSRLVIATFNGITAVSIFFVLSGAVLMNSLMHQRGSATEIGARFTIDRIFRIYPALIVWVLITAAADYVAGVPLSAKDVAENLALYDFAVLGQSATLNAEILATPLLLATFFVLRWRSLAGMALFGIIAVVAARHLPPRDLVAILRMYAYPIVLGMFIPTAAGRWIADRLPSGAAWAIIAAMLLVAHCTEQNMNTTRTLQETFAALLVVMLFYKKADVVGAWLERPHAALLGRISYSLYLANIPFLLIADRWLHGSFEGHRVAYALIVGPLVVLATIPPAVWSFRWIEQPCIQVGRKLWRRRSVKATRSGEVTSVAELAALGTEPSASRSGSSPPLG